MNKRSIIRQKTIPISILTLVLVLLAACSTTEEVQNPLIGTSAPDFRLENTTGGQTTLSEYQGTPVLLFFHMAVG